MTQHIDGWQVEPTVSVDYGANPLIGEPLAASMPSGTYGPVDGVSGASNEAGNPSPTIESGGHKGNGTATELPQLPPNVSDLGWLFTGK